MNMKMGSQQWTAPTVLVIAFWAFVLVPAAWPADQPAAQCRIDGGTAQPLALVSTNVFVGTNGVQEYLEFECAAQVSATNLSVGPHYLEVRLRGTNDVWCAWQGQWFDVSGDTGIEAAEWFLDTDPGEGDGVPIALPEDGVWGDPVEGFVVAVACSTNLDLGRHTLFVRCKDSNGDWGITRSSVFYVDRELRIVDAEWTHDHRALDGSASRSMRLTPTTNVAIGEVALVATTNTFALTDAYCADYSIYVRVKDSFGRYSTWRGMWWDAGERSWICDRQTWHSNAWAALSISPTVPSQPAPGHRCLGTSSNVTLNWTGAGASGYEVYGRSSMTEAMELWGTTTGDTFMMNLPGSGVYSWMVRALGGSQCQVDGPLWTFGVTYRRVDDTDGDGLPDWWERRWYPSLLLMDGTTDRDGDGRSDWQELICLTCPTNREDILDVSGLQVAPFLDFHEVVVGWSSVTGRSYTVYYCDDLLNTWDGWSVFGDVDGTGGMVGCTNYLDKAKAFFTVGVRSPEYP